jgi:Flp pilus assembly protein TadD
MPNTNRRMPEASPQLQIIFNKATTALAQGQTGLALILAQQANALVPNHPDVYNLLGVCAQRLQDRVSAEQCWRQAIHLQAESVEARFNLGLLHAETSQHDLAHNYLKQTLCVAPDYASAYVHLALLQVQEKQMDLAERSYRHALRVMPSDSASWNNLGLLLADQRRDGEAEISYRRALVIAPDDDKAYGNLGILLTRIKRRDEAERCYRHALDLNPGSAQAHANLGLLFAANNHMEAARAALLAAQVLAPESAEICSNLADLQAELLEDEDARQNYRAALIRKPDAAVSLSNYGVFLAYRFRDHDAEVCFRRALAVDPDYPVAKLNFSMLLLAQGRLRDAWPYHEARYDPKLPSPDTPKPSLPFPQWQGESLLGKSLIIWPEQGHGDLIQMCRYIPLIKARGAALITLVCRQNQVELMRTLPGVDTVIGSAEVGERDLDYDYWVFPMSFPLLFETDLDTIPLAIPYLHANEERIAYWSQRLTTRDRTQECRLRVGIVWRGNPEHANDSYRSLQSLSQLAPLLAIEDVSYFSLQIHNGPADIALDLARTPQIMDLGSQIRDFADTAAILQQLDLLISVDTAAAHLAGAMGMPCWVLLPSHRTDWRWMRDRADCPWYRDMCLFRQGPSHAWGDVIDNVASALRMHVAKR